MALALEVLRLSQREKMCLEMIAQGRRVQAISGILAIAPVTVEMHLKNAKRKLGAVTTAEAVGRAIYLGEIDPYR